MPDQEQDAPTRAASSRKPRGFDHKSAAAPTKAKPAKKAAARAKAKPKKPVKPRWKKGTSGNPAGAPQKFVSLISQSIKHTLGSAAPGMKQSYASAIGGISVKMVLKRMKADLAAGELSREALSFMELIMDRSEGKVPQPVTFPDALKILEGCSNEELEAIAKHGPRKT